MPQPAAASAAGCVRCAPHAAAPQRRAPRRNSGRCAGVRPASDAAPASAERRRRVAARALAVQGSRVSFPPLRSGPLGWLADRAAAVRAKVQNGFALAGRASAAAVLSSLPDVPPRLRPQAGREARTHSAALLYDGDAERMDADLRFYGDGFTLLARDMARDGHLLFRAKAELTPRELAARQRIAADARSLLPFSLLVMNTFPFTMAMLEPALKRGLPREWVLPSAFEESRLRSVHRARRLGTRAAASERQQDAADVRL